MVASVPDDTNRTRSTGVRATMSATAACTAGWAWPSSIGPREQMRSTYALPSTSVSQAPRAERMKRGVPPTALKARTGEFTPPGVTARARSKREADPAVPVVGPDGWLAGRAGVTRRLSPRRETGRRAGSGYTSPGVLQSTRLTQSSVTVMTCGNDRLHRACCGGEMRLTEVDH